MKQILFQSHFGIEQVLTSVFSKVSFSNTLVYKLIRPTQVFCKTDNAFICFSIRVPPPPTFTPTLQQFLYIRTLCVTRWLPCLLVPSTAAGLLRCAQPRVLVLVGWRSRAKGYRLTAYKPARTPALNTTYR